MARFSAVMVAKNPVWDRNARRQEFVISGGLLVAVSLSIPAGWDWVLFQQHEIYASSSTFSSSRAALSAGLSFLGQSHVALLWSLWPDAVNVAFAGRCDVCNRVNSLYSFVLSAHRQIQAGREFCGYWCAVCGFSNAGSRPLLNSSKAEISKTAV